MESKRFPHPLIRLGQISLPPLYVQQRRLLKWVMPVDGMSKDFKVMMVIVCLNEKIV